MGFPHPGEIGEFWTSLSKSEYRICMTVAQIKKHYPELKFKASNRFVWSPRRRTVYYDPQLVETSEGLQALLHELSHALLHHENYELDIELINMEVEAWSKAKELAPQFDVKISDDHVDYCLESYRIWLFKRSQCPVCESTSIQENETTYRCFNCQASWKVAQTKSLQPRRMQLVTATL